MTTFPRSPRLLKGGLVQGRLHQPQQEVAPSSFLQRRSKDPSPAAAPPIVHEVLRSPGQPLDPAARAFLEPRLGRDFSSIRSRSEGPQRQSVDLEVGAKADPAEEEANRIAQKVSAPRPSSVHDSPRHDFSRVRVHTDAQAAESAASLGAAAYTVGRDIVFGAGRYAPETGPGRTLLAHELTHVVQQSDTSRPVLRAQPAGTTPAPAAPASKPGTGPEMPKGKLTWTWKDLSMYPLLKEIWHDVITKRTLTPEEIKKLALNGTELAAFFTWASAAGFAVAGLGGETTQGKGVGKSLSTVNKYAESMGKLTPSKSAILDVLSALAGIRLDDYLASDRFKARAKEHVASVVALYLVLQGGYSLAQEVTPESGKQGEMTDADWSKHLALITGLVGVIFKEHLKAPDFFDVGPLEMATHPAFAASFIGGNPPSGLTAEGKKGIGAEGSELKLGLTLNLPKLIVPSLREGTTAEDIGNLAKYRGWQGSLWFAYDKSTPTEALQQMGKLPDEKFKAGTILGSGGHLMLLEVGGRYGGEQARQLTSFFAKGGYGFNGAQGSVLNKVGFTATFVDWTQKDLLAPGQDTGSPAAGRALRVTPFAKLQLDRGRHKFDAGAALSFVSGTGDPFNLSGLRGDLSYTYLGNAGPGQTPMFKLDLSGSLERLDWWNPASPLLWGVEGKMNIKNFYTGVKVMGGAGDIPDSRARLIAPEVPNMVPMGVLFTIGGTLEKSKK